MTLVELVPDQARFTTDPHSRYAQLRAQGAVHHVLLPSKEAAWLVTDAAAVRAALADERLRNDIRHSASWTHDGGYAIGRNLLQVDPPDHPRLRRLVAGEFTRHRIQALRQRVQDIADGLVDAMAPAGRADLVDAYAFPLPVTVICELLGVPGADRDTFRAWSAEIVAATNHETASAAASAMTGYLTDLIETKRSQPLAAHTEADGSAKGDLLHALAHANSTQEEPLTPPELLGMAFLLLVAGHETTANLIASTVHLLLRHPAQLAALQADWTLLEGTVEEAMRYEPPHWPPPTATPSNQSRSPAPPSPRAPPSFSAWPPPTETRHCSPTRTDSTSTATPPTPAPTCHSATAYTTASARHWHDWKPQSQSGPSSNTSPTSRRRTHPPLPNGVPASCADCTDCP